MRSTGVRAVAGLVILLALVAGALLADERRSVPSLDHVIATGAAAGSEPGAADPVGPVVASGSAEIGRWVDVTPHDMALIGGSCDSYGVTSIAVDPAAPSDLYVMADCFGVWRSTDYGITWNGPIDIGRNGAAARDCAGGISVAHDDADAPVTLYRACIRGTGMGFWRSDDGGVNWQRFPIGVTDRQDYYAPAVDPYDGDHLLMAGHEMNVLAESRDGGETWQEVPMDPAMAGPGGTGSVLFVDTGDPVTTRRTWLYTGQWNEGNTGTWRTEDGGERWTRVDSMEKPHGQYQIYQPDAGAILAAGLSGSDGHGIYRSTDAGRTWDMVHEGFSAVLWGSDDTVYSGYSWACGDCAVDAEFRRAPSPGAGNWAEGPEQPAEMAMGPATVAVTFDGERYVFVSANWRDGVWRYVEG